jgi:hypothetical protein
MGKVVKPVKLAKVDKLNNGINEIILLELSPVCTRPVKIQMPHGPKSKGG